MRLRPDDNGRLQSPPRGTSYCKSGPRRRLRYQITLKMTTTVANTNNAPNATSCTSRWASCANAGDANVQSRPNAKMTRPVKVMCTPKTLLFKNCVQKLSEDGESCCRNSSIMRTTAALRLGRTRCRLRQASILLTSCGSMRMSIFAVLRCMPGEIGRGQVHLLDNSSQKLDGL